MTCEDFRRYIGKRDYGTEGETEDAVRHIGHCYKCRNWFNVETDERIRQSDLDLHAGRSTEVS